MSALPFRVNRKLRVIAEERLKPLWVELDHELKILSWAGNEYFYGFKDIDKGDDGTQRFPFLIDLNIKDTLKIPYVDMNNGCAAHIDIFKHHGHYYILFIDATEPRRRQQELQQKANELNLQAYQQSKLMRALKKARDDLAIKRHQAEEASAAKSRFISGMSHEFRTPLTAIMGYIDYLKNHPEHHQQLPNYLNSIERSARHLLSLVNNVLDQARLDAEELVIYPTPMNPVSITEDIVAIFQPLASDKNLDFNMSVGDQLPRCLELDGVRVRQILFNLVDNALKFTENGEISVEMDWRENQLIAAVVDTGPGIPDTGIERIFQAFQSLNNRNPGAGLGLFISQHLALLMGGSLSVDSKPGIGSRFCLRLPAVTIQPVSSASEKHLPSNPTSPNHPFPKGRVLIAEDNDDIVQLVELFLTDAGYEVIVASNGEQAVHSALRDEPDLVLMDLNLPLFDGFLVTERLRRSHFTNPIVALTASPSEKDRIRALEAGCNGYLLKPIDMPHLVALTHQLARKNLHDF